MLWLAQGNRVTEVPDVLGRIIVQEAMGTFSLEES